MRVGHHEDFVEGNSISGFLKVLIEADDRKKSHNHHSEIETYYLVIDPPLDSISWLLLEKVKINCRSK